MWQRWKKSFLSPLLTRQTAPPLALKATYWPGSTNVSYESREASPRHAASPTCELGELVLSHRSRCSPAGANRHPLLVWPKNTKLPQAACSSSVLNQVGCWPFISSAGSQQASHGELYSQQVPACVVPVLGWAVAGRGKWLKLCTKRKQGQVPLYAISGKPSILPSSCRLMMTSFMHCFHHNSLPMINKTLVQWGHSIVWSLPVLPTYRQQ